MGAADVLGLCPTNFANGEHIHAVIRESQLFFRTVSFLVRVQAPVNKTSQKGSNAMAWLA